MFHMSPVSRRSSQGGPAFWGFQHIPTEETSNWSPTFSVAIDTSQKGMSPDTAPAPIDGHRKIPGAGEKWCQVDEPDPSAQLSLPLLLLVRELFISSFPYLFDLQYSLLCFRATLFLSLMLSIFSFLQSFIFWTLRGNLSSKASPPRSLPRFCVGDEGARGEKYDEFHVFLSPV